MSSDFFGEGISSHVFHKQAKLMHKQTLLSYVALGVLKRALFSPVKASFCFVFSPLAQSIWADLRGNRPR